MHARERDIAKYDGKYDQGYDPIRQARLEKMKRLGVVAPNAEMTPLVGNWDNVEDKEWESACMEVYAAMVDQMDQGIGRIVKTLKSKGELDNTLIMFMQDNGGCAEPCARKEKGPRIVRADTPETAAELSGMAQSIGYLVAATGPPLFGGLYDFTGGWVVPLTSLLVVLVLKLVVGLPAARDEQVHRTV